MTIAEIERIHGQPVDNMQLFRKTTTADKVIYTGVPLKNWHRLIQKAKETQDFDQIKYLLIRTSIEPQVRYYPVCLLLDNDRHPAWFAEDAYQRLHAKVAMSFTGRVKSVLCSLRSLAS